MKCDPKRSCYRKRSDESAIVNLIGSCCHDRFSDGVIDNRLLTCSGLRPMLSGMAARAAADLLMDGREACRRTMSAGALSDRHRYRRHLHRYRLGRYRLRRDAASPRLPSTPANPAIGLLRGVEAILDAGRRHDRRRRGPCARHHGRDQRAAAGRDQFARPDRHCGLPAHPRDRPPVGAGRLRQFVFLGEAGPDRAAAICPRGRRPTEFSRR